jgi:hypothetical protein
MATERKVAIERPQQIANMKNYDALINIIASSL